MATKKQVAAKKVAKQVAKAPFAKGKVAKKMPASSAKPKKQAYKIPKTLAGCADALYTAKNERLELQKSTMEPLTKYEKELKAHLIDNLPKSKAEGISGSVANVKVVKKEIPIVEDEKKFLAYANKKGNEDLLKIGVNMEAVNARIEEGKKIPGIGIFHAVTLSVTKR